MESFRTTRMAGGGDGTVTSSVLIVPLYRAKCRPSRFPRRLVGEGGKMCGSTGGRNASAAAGDSGDLQDLFHNLLRLKAFRVDDVVRLREHRLPLHEHALQLSEGVGAHEQRPGRPLVAE